jgi:multidrug efflux pump subunit AcrA (membrane-fusion protein)
MVRLSIAVTLAGLGATRAGCASHAPHPTPETASIALTVTTAHLVPLPVVYRASGTVRGRNTRREAQRAQKQILLKRPHF